MRPINPPEENEDYCLLCEEDVNPRYTRHITKGNTEGYLCDGCFQGFYCEEDELDEILNEECDKSQTK